MLSDSLSVTLLHTLVEYVRVVWRLGITDTIQLQGISFTMPPDENTELSLTCTRGSTWDTITITLSGDTNQEVAPSFSIQYTGQNIVVIATQPSSELARKALFHASLAVLDFLLAWVSSNRCQLIATVSAAEATATS